MIVGAELTQIKWVDDDGATWVSVAPHGTEPQDGWRYPRLGPPPIAERLMAEGFPRPVANAIQAELVAAGILTARDMRRQGAPEQIDGMIRRAVRGSVQTVIDAFVVD